MNDPAQVIRDALYAHQYQAHRALDALLAEKERLGEEVRLRAESQIPMIPRDAQALMEWLERELEEQYAAVRHASDLQDEAEAKKERLEESLRGVHEYHCGCDRPGNPSACVAEPLEEFSVLAGDAATPDANDLSDALTDQQFPDYSEQKAGDAATGEQM